MITIASNHKDLQAINYGRDSENSPPKKNNHKRNLDQKPFVQTAKDTFDMLMRHDHVAACLWHTMISMPEIWHYRIPDLAKRINVCVNTCRLKMNILIKFGLVNREKIAGGQTEYEVYQFPEDNPLKSQSTTKSIDLTTYPRKNINIYTKQHSNNNLVSPKPVPESVVDTQNNFEKEKKHDINHVPDGSEKINLTLKTNGIPSGGTNPIDNDQITRNNQTVDINPAPNPTKKEALIAIEKTHDKPGPTFPGLSTEMDAVIEKINPEYRDKIPISLLDKHIGDYSVDQITDICIYAIDKTSSGNRNPDHHRRRIEGYCRVLFNKHVTVPAQKHYTTFENRDTIPLPEPKQLNYDFRKKWDEHHNRIKKVTETCVKETSEIENIKEKTVTYENVFDNVDMGSLIDRLKKRKPVIDPKFKSRRKYLDRIGRPDLREV